MQKRAEATAVPFADSAVDTASAAPLPGLAVGNKPAPGQRGPTGLSPRTNYSRVNTGSSPTVDAGSTSQKSNPPDSQGFLPPKIAEVSMRTTARMTIQEMIKAAAQGAMDQGSIALEAERQAGLPGSTTKAASVEEESPAPSTQYCMKLAEAAEYVLSSMKLAEEVGPGSGPNALEVSKAIDPANGVEAGQLGAATPAHIPPKDPPMAAPSGQKGGPATALADNEKMKVGSARIQAMRKAAATACAKAGEGMPEALTDKKKEPKQDEAGEKKEEGEKKASAVDPRLVELWLSMTKHAEDAINPAHISAGPAVSPETSAAGEAGGEPAGGAPQGATSLISSNEAAINYTKGQAKAPVKAQLKDLLSEPALSSAHDNVLGKAFAHTGEAGVKVSSLRAASVRALLEKFAEDADVKGAKKKTSQGMGAFTAPPVGGAAGNAGM